MKTGTKMADLSYLIKTPTRALFMLGAFATVVCGAAFLGRSVQPNAAPPTFRQGAGSSPQDACSLITQSDIASVQGVQAQRPQPSSQKYGDLVILQCYYTAVSADGRDNLSVHLQVIRPDSQSARRDPLKEFWKDQLDRDAKAQTRVENHEEAELEKRIKAPVRVSGLGEEAFWLAGRRGGALYVLNKNRVLRVAVGDRDVQAQIEKSKALAGKALRRLS